MVYSYSPSYYSSLNDSLASLCKSLLLPFSSHRSRHRHLPSSDEDHADKFAKRQTDNLKWQQDSFHRILHLVGLHKEGLVPEAEVSAFRARLLDTLLASPKEPEPAGLTRDRLLFLQDLLYAECISADQYRSSERPLLQRLRGEERPVVELREREPPPPVEKAEQQTPAKSLFNWKGKAKKDPSANAGSVLMPESSSGADEPEKRKPFRALLDDNKSESSAQKKPAKKHWGFNGLKKWRRGDDVKEDESTALRCDGFAEGENTKEEEEQEVNEPLAADKELEDQSNSYNGDSMGWVAFEENEENYHPNLFFRDRSVSNQGTDDANRKAQKNKDDGGRRDCFLNNPFIDDDQNPLE